jgi:hypothetical protein
MQTSSFIGGGGPEGAFTDEVPVGDARVGDSIRSTWPPCARCWRSPARRLGKDVYTLMREISLPDKLKIGEFHGNVCWAVRAIWREYSGWFLYDCTTSLYGNPRLSVDKDLVELA